MKEIFLNISLFFFNNKKIYPYFVFFIYSAIFAITWNMIGIYDFDTSLTIIFPIKWGNAPMLTLYSPLLGSVVYFINGLTNLNPANILIIFSIITIFTIYILIYKILFNITGDAFFSLLISSLHVFSHAFYWVAFRSDFDDNFFQVPLILFSFYLLLYYKNNLYVFLSGLFFSIALSIHIQIILLGPTFLIIIIILNKDLKIQKKLKQIMIFSLGALLIFLPVFIIFKFFHSLTSSVQNSYLNYPEWYFFAKKRSILEIFQWIINWINNMIKFNSIYKYKISNLINYPIFLLSLGLIFWTHKYYFLKKKLNNLFYLSIFSFLLFFAGAVFSFVYESSSAERWCTGTGFLFIYFGVNLFIFYEFLREKNKLLYKIFKYGLSIIVIIIFSINIIFFMKFRGFEKQKLEALFKNIPKDAIVLTSDNYWFFGNYHPGKLFFNIPRKEYMEKGILKSFNNIDDLLINNELYIHESAKGIVEEKLLYNIYRIDINKIKDFYYLIKIKN